MTTLDSPPVWSPFRGGSLPRFVGVVLLVLTAASTLLSQSTWTVIDLGTLGGEFGDAEDINEAGQIVGTSYTPSGVEHAFLWTAATGTVDLGTLGGERSGAEAINDLGQVVGHSERPGPGHITVAVLWTPTGQAIDLGYLGEFFPGFGSSRAIDINNSGQVVGVSSTTTGTHAFLWTEAGGMVDLGTLGGDRSAADAINDAGQVVGRSDTSTGEEHAFLWSAGTGMIDLGTLGGQSSLALGINASGHVVGRADVESGDVHAFLWKPGEGMLDLGSPGGPGSRSQAHGINDNGEIVGLVNPAEDGLDRAFYWTSGGGMVELPTLTGVESGARAINNTGVVAGYGDIASGVAHPVRWTSTAPPDDSGPKVQLCHYTGNGSYHLIDVSLDAEAAHRAHGDGKIGEAVPGSPGKVFTASCTVQ